MKYKILGSIWFRPVLARPLIGGDMCIGIVAIESNGSEWKCYIGYGLGRHEAVDEQRIALNGQPLGNKDAACGFFPQLDPGGFRY